MFVNTESGIGKIAIHFLVRMKYLFYRRRKAEFIKKNGQDYTQCLPERLFRL